MDGEKDFVEDKKQPVNPKAKAHLEERLGKQYPPVKLDRRARNTHDCGEAPERDECEF